MSKEKIILLGGGGHCKSVIDVIEQEGRFEIAGIVEKFVGESSEVLGYPLIGTDDALAELRTKYEYAFVSVGHIKSNAIRVKLFAKLEALSFNIPTIISPFAYVSKYAHIDKGTIIMHHALVNADAQIGKNCIINSKALIEHDVVVGEHSHISTGVILNGGVEVQAGSFVGSGVTTKEYAKLSGFVKAGSVVR